MYVILCMYIRIYVFNMYVCMYVCIYVLYVRTYLCMYVCMVYVCMHVSMGVHMLVCIHCYGSLTGVAQRTERPNIQGVFNIQGYGI